jgi:hypothetical protein
MAPHIACFWTLRVGPSRRTNLAYSRTNLAYRRSLRSRSLAYAITRLRLPRIVEGWRVQDECSQRTFTGFFGQE